MKKQLLLLLPVFLFFTVFIYFISENFFFWDTIKLVSAPAHFFYENDFNKFIIPNKFDAGHISGLAFYIALIWKIFPKNITVSHFAMLPFVLGITWQGYSLITRYMSNKKDALIVLILALSGPTILSQFSLVSPEIPLLFFFLLGINLLFLKKEFLFSFAVLCLFLISSRGVVLALVLLITDLLVEFQFIGIKKQITLWFRKSFKYIPAFFVFVVYQLYHYEVAGWIFSHENSPWIENRNTNNLGGAIYNLGILTWRMLDFGRIFILIILFTLLLKKRKLIQKDREIRSLLIVLGIAFALFILLFMRYKYLTAHRYLLPIYFLVTIFTGYLIVEYVKSKRLKYIIFVFLFIGLLTGNFWVYPNKISQGWDSTLAHLPYYSLQTEMLNYLDKEDININEVGAEFPALAEQQIIMLNENTNSFKAKEVGIDRYVIFTNINNDFSDDEMDSLESEYIIKKEFKSVQVFVRLYEKID